MKITKAKLNMVGFALAKKMKDGTKLNSITFQEGQYIFQFFNVKEMFVVGGKMLEIKKYTPQQIELLYNNL